MLPHMFELFNSESHVKIVVMQIKILINSNHSEWRRLLRKRQFCSTRFLI